MKETFRSQSSGLLVEIFILKSTETLAIFFLVPALLLVVVKISGLVTQCMNVDVKVQERLQVIVHEGWAV